MASRKVLHREMTRRNIKARSLNHYYRGKH